MPRVRVGMEMLECMLGCLLPEWAGLWGEQHPPHAPSIVRRWVSRCRALCILQRSMFGWSQLQLACRASFYEQKVQQAGRWQTSLPRQDCSHLDSGAVAAYPKPQILNPTF